MTSTMVPQQSSSRSQLRAVALPSEHGGWGLTLEPGLAGLLVSPSLAGACLAAAALVAFMARTPLKIVLVDRRRGRSLPRTALARRVAAVELLVLGGLAATALAYAEPWFWVPLVMASPLVALEGWFEVRSRGRRLAPELAGALGVCSVAPMIVIADGGGFRLAAALWFVLGARVVTSIPHVRAQIARIHGRTGDAGTTFVADGLALAAPVFAVVLDTRLLAGAIAVAVVVALQRLTSRGPAPRAVVLGMRQMAFGFGVVIVTALGVLATAS